MQQHLEFYYNRHFSIQLVHFDWFHFYASVEYYYVCGTPGTSRHCLFRKKILNYLLNVPIKRS